MRPVDKIIANVAVGAIWVETVFRIWTNVLFYSIVDSFRLLLTVIWYYTNGWAHHTELMVGVVWQSSPLEYVYYLYYWEVGLCSWHIIILPSARGANAVNHTQHSNRPNLPPKPGQTDKVLYTQCQWCCINQGSNLVLPPQPHTDCSMKCQPVPCIMSHHIPTKWSIFTVFNLVKGHIGHDGCVNKFYIIWDMVGMKDMLQANAIACFA